MSWSAVVKVRLTTSMVSLLGQSQAASMWEFPARSILASERTGWRVVRISWAWRRDLSKAVWSAAARALRSMAATASSTLGGRSLRGVAGGGGGLAA